MKMTSTKYTDEELNYFRVCKVTTHIMTDGLRTVFKKEWDNRYKATHGHWQDTTKNGSDFDGMELTKSRKRNARLLALMRNGNTKEWDCTCLFHAILYSASIGPTLNPRVKKSVDELREFRNDVFAHTADGKLTAAEFEAAINKAITAFTDLKLDTTDIEEIKNQTSFPTDELEDIKNQLEKKPGPFRVLPAKPSHETVYRPNEVENINKEMERLKNTKKNEVTVLYLSGNPGCGKSEIARQVGERFFDKSGTEMSFVMTLNASTIDTLLQSFVEFAGRLRCDEEMVVKISTSASLSKERKMNNLSLIAPRMEGYSSWLMILDNVSDLKSVSKYWPQAGEKTSGVGQIMVTTQDSSSIPTDSYTYHLSLKQGMNLDDAISTLSRLSGSSAEESILHEVVIALDFQPLALACAAVYMQRIQSTDWTKYLEKLKEGKREATETVYKKTSSTYPATMTEAVRMAVEKEVSEDEVMRYAFQFLSVIAAEPISLDYVVQYVLKCLPDEDEDLVASTVCSSSLVLSSDKEESKDIHVHQVVHSCLQIPFSRGESEVKFNIIVDVILAFPNIKNINLDDDDGFDTALSLLPHFTTFISRMHHCIQNYRDAMANSIKERGIEMIEYVLRIKSCFGTHGRHELSEVLLEILRSITEGVEDKKHPSFAEGLVGIADCLRVLGRNDEALENLLKALEIQESEDGGNNHLMIETLINLGSRLGNFQGKEKEAQQYVERALKRIEKLQLTGEDYTFLTANTLNVQGNVFESMGQLEKALECHKKALTFVRNKSGKVRDLLSCYTLSRMGRILCFLGQLEESKRLLQQGLAIFEKHSDFYAKHTGLVHLFTHLGETSYRLGQFNEAENHFKKVLDILMDYSIPFEQSLITEILESLARCATSLKKHEEAIHYRKKALENMNDKNHPQFANTLFDIGVSYFNLKKYQESISCLEKVVVLDTKIHGEEHEELVLSLYQLAMAYISLEQYQDAKVFLEKALKIERNLNGREHPKLVLTLHYLGICYFRVEMFTKAITCLDEAITRMGEDQLEVVNTLFFLGISHLELGQYDQATAILEKLLVTKEMDLETEQLANTLYFLGFSLCEQGQSGKKAITCLKRALTIGRSCFGEESPKIFDILYRLGIIYFTRQEYQIAIHYLEHAVRIRDHREEDPELLGVFHFLGLSYFGQLFK